ncbi:hypothetical protein FOA52_014353 [Chlamydomonas sp. UWO 241]|nr:hypothetical protein FOA52_014353 [Chlamydomonas sp. UWO 241]
MGGGISKEQILAHMRVGATGGSAPPAEDDYYSHHAASTMHNTAAEEEEPQQRPQVAAYHAPPAQEPPPRVPSRARMPSRARTSRAAMPRAVAEEAEDLMAVLQGPPTPVSGPKPVDKRDLVTESAVKVIIAVRGLLKPGIEANCKDIIKVAGGNEIQLPNNTPTGSVPQFTKTGVIEYDDGVRRFEFDKTFKIESVRASKELFGMVVPVVERFCQGFNGCVLAYGQTGSGKTFTMGTTATEKEFNAAEPRGILPRMLRLLMSYLDHASTSYETTLKVQYVEVYKDAIFDLLGDDNGLVKLDLHERMKGAITEIFVAGAVEETVSTAEEVAALLIRGNKNRTVAPHNMNTESSRSHAILTLQMDQHIKLEASLTIPRDQHFLRSKLNLVDLAGSERVMETGATGDRFKEGVAINKGLHELGNVINALALGKETKHIPYRNSKLTRLLSDSLGGNSETLFIACCSPADKNYEATLGTMRYATRVRAIKNTLKMNRMSKEEELSYLRELVRELQNEADKYKQFSAELRAQLAAAGRSAPSRPSSAMSMSLPGGFPMGDDTQHGDQGPQAASTGRGKSNMVRGRAAAQPSNKSLDASGMSGMSSTNGSAGGARSKSTARARTASKAPAAPGGWAR